MKISKLKMFRCGFALAMMLVAGCQAFTDFDGYHFGNGDTSSDISTASEQITVVGTESDTDRIDTAQGTATETTADTQTYTDTDSTIDTVSGDETDSGVVETDSIEPLDTTTVTDSDTVLVSTDDTATDTATIAPPETDWPTDSDTASDSASDTGTGSDSSDTQTETDTETATETDTPSDTSPGQICGNGVLEGNEMCDDGNTVSNDGCHMCQVTAGYACSQVSGNTVCMPIPAVPLLGGEASCNHSDPTWIWTRPANTDYLQYRINGGAWSDTNAQTYTGSGMSGTVSFEVRACNGLDACSNAAVFVTTIEHFGTSYPTVWNGVANASLPMTPLGNVVPICCHNCYNGIDNAVLSTEDAMTKINVAVSRGAALIELDVALAGSDICLTHEDVSTCTGRPTLPEILDDSAFRISDAILFIEIKEDDAPVDVFADALIPLLEANRDYMKNGRPVFFRAFSSRRSYLTAVRERLAASPLISNYAKFSVLYNALEDSGIAAFQQTIETEVAAAGFDMVEVKYTSKDLLSILSFAKSLGLAVGVWTIPANFGAAFIGSLREEVDQITTERRVDMAKDNVEIINTLAYVNVSECSSATDSTVSVFRNTSGTMTEEHVAVDRAPTTTLYGTPALHFDPEGEDRFGCSLDYRSNQGYGERGLPLGMTTNDADGGFLVTAYVNFDDLTTIAEGTMGIVQNSQSGGFALELHREADDSVVIRFGVNLDDGYHYHQYNVDTTGLARNPSLNGTDAYFLTGLYDGAGGLYLFVDFERDGLGGSYTEGVNQSPLPAIAGADPHRQPRIRRRLV